MVVVIPNSINCPELQYSINVLLRQFLGLEFEIITKDITSTLFRVDNRSLTIANHFFKPGKDSCQFESTLLPTVITNSYINIGSKRFPVVTLYGDARLENNEGELVLHSDILASTFFMLTRWEEEVNPARDMHGRFPAKESIAYKHGFLDRPIVNEYVELLWVLLQQIGCSQEREKRSYKLVPTHDVDKPYLLNGWKSSLRTALGTIKRGRFHELGRFVNCWVRGNDPFDTYDRLMDLSESQQSKSHFFFLQKGKAKQDEDHDIEQPRIQRLIGHILARGHYVGYHPSYLAHGDGDLFVMEKSKLEKVARQEINTGRHHFLRWDVSASPEMWQSNNMKWDSTLGYADHAGFRCGVCYPFPLYDLKNDIQLDVYERPLIAMEWSLIYYQRLEIGEAEKYINKLKGEVKKYNGEFVFLYHNSAFYTDEYQTVSNRLLNAFYN